MAYQKDTANTVAQAFDKFLAFCCLHGGYTRTPDSGTIKGISKGNVKYTFDTSLKKSTVSYAKGNYISCSMSVTDIPQPKEVRCATWMFSPPFVAIDMFANSKDCYLVIELSTGVFTTIGIGNVVDLVGDVNIGSFLVANGMLAANGTSDLSVYSDCITYSYNQSSFFNTPSRVQPGATMHKEASYIFDGSFKEIQRSVNSYMCGHNNTLTDTLIVRTPASNILRHTPCPIYYIDKHPTENTEYIKGYVYGCRTSGTALLQPRDIIADTWMIFPVTSINDNNTMYPPCSGRGYLFNTGD